MSALRESVVAWPLLATGAALALAGLRAGRRRSALNQAMHELRRPLQALALSGLPEHAATVRLAAAALERLDREINGGLAAGARTGVQVHDLVAAAVRRWQARARLCQTSLSLREEARLSTVEGDPAALGQALDNLVVNAIEHGGSRVVVETRSTRSWLRISVLDSGGDRRAGGRASSPAETIGRLTGRRRRGHGLNVVRGVVADHAGRFWLRTRPQGTAAVIELPLPRCGGDSAA
jgi:signal transduction histidine kinase